jgi:hypothetical protein
MVFAPTRSLLSRELGDLHAFELVLEGREKPAVIRTRGRRVWCRDGLQAVRFLCMHDVDRLTIAEHIDRLHFAGARLH